MVTHLGSFRYAKSIKKLTQLKQEESLNIISIGLRQNLVEIM